MNKNTEEGLDAINQLSTKQNYDMKNIAQGGNPAPTFVNWRRKHKKQKKVVKTIIKKPVFNVIPFNLKSLHTFMTKLYDNQGQLRSAAEISGHTQPLVDSATQTNQEVDLVSVSDTEPDEEMIDLKVDQFDSNPYETYDTVNRKSSKIKITDKTQMKPNFTQSKMRIKRKKKTTRGIKAESMSDVED